jgi:nicotinamide-nucleotide amidase
VSEVTRADPPADGLAAVPAENRIVEALVERGWTVAVAESLTAGAVARRLCLCPGTEDRVLGGVVAYSTRAKREVLSVKADGVVTGEAVIQMASGARDVFGSDVGVASSGVAGPESQEDQPVGTVFVGWSTPEGEGSVQLACAGTPEQIRQEATERALELLLDALEGTRSHGV